MKKNKAMRFAALLLVLVLMTSSVVGGTFAKYTSSASGYDTARVAKWDVEVEGTKLGVENATVTFDLFETVLDSDGGEELDVAAADDETIIAPGTSGSFELNIANKSEVNARYTVTLTEFNDNAIPLQYSLDGKTWADSAAELAAEGLTDVDIAMGTGAAAHTVYWRWVFEGTTEGAHAGQTDAYDTALGILDPSASVTITAQITVEQVD